MTFGQTQRDRGGLWGASMPWSMRSQRVRHDFVTEQQQLTIDKVKNRYRDDGWRPFLHLSLATCPSGQKE